MARISIFGLGRVGLVTAVCLARKGYRVVGIDPDSKKVNVLQKGEAPFFEPCLETYLKKAILHKTFTATTDFQVNSESDFAYITVGTPSNPDGSINLNNLKTAAVNIGTSLRNSSGYQLVIVKSTIIPGTTRNHVKPLIEKQSEKHCGKEFGLCTNPEFLREGCAIKDNENPNRIIIGCDDKYAAERLAAFYRGIMPHVPPERLIITSPENAEFIKYVSNAFLATKISFINMIASLAERVPYSDIAIIANGIGLDARIGSQFLKAGLGWGGSCFPKDLRALTAFCKKRGCDPRLIKATIEVNKKQPLKALELARLALGSVKHKRIAILGLAFKPNTDDMREAVSIPIINRFLSEDARIVAYDPLALHNARELFKNRIEYATSVEACLKQADLALVVTEWEEFKKLTPQDFITLMKTPIVLDGRRIYNPDQMQSSRIFFAAIGLGKRR
jgi:UDPglucose 6-dehydrogenase